MRTAVMLAVVFVGALACTQHTHMLPAGASEIEPPAACATSLQVPHASFSTPRLDWALIERERAIIRRQIEARMRSAGLDGAVAETLCSGFRCVRFAAANDGVIRCAWPDKVPAWRRPAPPEQWCLQIERNEGRMTPYVLFNYEQRRCLP
jgi:hypothetical protein